MSVVTIVAASPFTIRSNRIRYADFYKNPSSTTYYVLVDLDNGGSSYSHTYSAGKWIKIVRTEGSLVKAKVADVWDSKLGVIVSIDGTSANVIWINPGSIQARDTGKFEGRSSVSFFVDPVPLEVSAGDLSDMAAGNEETGITAINTGITLKDVKDVDVTPAVGDLILKATRTSGTGSAEISLLAGYLVM